MPTISDEVVALRPRLIELRRDLHQHPELKDGALDGVSPDVAFAVHMNNEDADCAARARLALSPRRKRRGE